MAVTLRWRALAPFGAEIERDLDEPFGPSEAYHFRELLKEHGLLLMRGQRLSMQRQRGICAMIGPILLRAGEGETMTNEGGGPAASELTWHADAAYTEHPFEALSLHALDVVDGASSTRFVHAGDAWDRLPADLREHLAGRAQAMVSPHYSRLAARTCDQPQGDALVRATRPTVLRHPATGRDCLWVSELQTAGLIGMDETESRSILHRVFAALYAQDAVFEHRWRTGDLIVWDNIALQHSRGNLAGVGRRVLQRVIVGSEGVAPHVAAG
jgi:taurine dioxygenase